MDKLTGYWKKRNKEYLEEARYSTWTFRRLIDRFFHDMKGKRAIDLGCGYGLILNHLKERGAKAEGLEICDEVVDRMKSRKDVKVIHGDCREAPIPDNTYDYVMSFGVIEHIPEWEKSVIEHFRICKPGGKVLIAVPYLYSPVYYIMAISYFLKIIKYGFRVTAGKPFTKNELRKEMEKYGKIIDESAFDFCCLLEPLTKKKRIKLAEFLENNFGFMGVMIYCIAEKEKNKE